MAITRMLSVARRDEVVHQMCQRSQPAELEWTHGPAVQTGKTRFLAVVVEGKARQLVIEAPTQVGKTLVVHTGESVDVVLQQAGQRLGFRAEVKTRCFHEISEGLSVPALVISYPEEVEIRQRRSYYRVPMDAKDSAAVTFREAEVSAGDEDETVYSGIISDISVGGMAIQVRQPLPARFAVRTRLNLFFRLPDSGESLSMDAEIRGSRPPQRGPGRIYGVEFINTDRTLESHRAINSIQKFVAIRQREMLKRIKGS